MYQDFQSELTNPPDDSPWLVDPDVDANYEWLRTIALGLLLLLGGAVVVGAAITVWVWGMVVHWPWSGNCVAQIMCG